MNHKEVFAWGMYDLANTIFSALFVSFFFPFYIKQFLGGSDALVGITFSLSMLAVAFLVPIIGSWSDHVGKRLPFIMFFTALCCVFTLLVIGANLVFALVAGFFANFAFHAALTTYNALLPSLASKKEIGFVSGIGIAMGYGGTLIALGVAALILSKFGWETLEGTKAIFVATAIMFAIFSIPTFVMLKEKVKKHKSHLKFKDAIFSVFTTIRHLHDHSNIFKFLLSMFFYTNAINAAIVFLFLFGKAQIGLTVKSFFVVYAIQSVGAVLGSVYSGKAVDKYGSTRILMIAGFVWLIVIGILMFVQDFTTFMVAGTIGAAAMGAVWTAQRPKLLELIDHKKAGQYFGFLELSGKFGGILGPFTFGMLATYVNYTAALGSLAAFFVVGLFILKGVD